MPATDVRRREGRSWTTGTQEDLPDGLGKLGPANDLLDLGRDPFPRRLRIAQLLSHQRQVDVGEQLFQRGFSIEQVLYIRLVL